MFPAANTFSVDFHPIPYRGDPTGLDRHYIPSRGAAGPSVQTFFALEQESRCLCYANANLTRGDQHGELMRFVEFWHALTDHDPQWLYFDSKLVDYAELSRVNQRGIHFITIRRRGAGILRRLDTLPRSGWTGTVLDTPQRCHQRIWYVNDVIKLRGYEGPIRQLAVDGLGREKPTLFLSNHFEETARNVIIRYAGRNRVEDGLGISVNFFHLDCLASEVRLNVDLDATMTVLANGCYRWLGKQLRGYEKADPKKLYRLFVATEGTVRTTPDELVVRFERAQPQPDPPRGCLGSGADPHSLARRPTNPVCLPVAPTTVRKLIIFRAAEFRVDWSLKLTRPGSMIIVDNVVRKGAVVNADGDDSKVQGVRRFYERLAAEPRVSATAIQTVGSKGYDGFAIALVN